MLTGKKMGLDKKWQIIIFLSNIIQSTNTFHSSFKRYVLLLHMHLYFCMRMPTCVRLLLRPEPLDYPGAGLTDSCKVPSMDAGSWTRVSWKSNKHSLFPSHHSWHQQNLFFITETELLLGWEIYYSFTYLLMLKSCFLM